jgi:2-polyprenyl-3-methyl-5-hydroxy-6-metoxy-1,4-benzoquinol methylase
MEAQRMDKSEKFWDRMSKNYDRQAGNDTIYKRTLEITKKHLKSSDIVLDFACATGLYSIELANNVKEIQGIDISSKMVEAAKRKAGERKFENIDFAQATIFDERYKKESFNVILAFNILHLLEDTQKVVQRINELLRPGGLIIASTACLKEKKTFLSFLFFLLVFSLTKIGIVPHVRFFKISELENLITNGNFQIVKTESLNHSPQEYFIVAKKI